jgi:GntR family transcriptional regulator, transcriptional repressor for pyruvate dehydrogenase complex
VDIQPAHKVTLIDSVKEQLLSLIRVGHLKPGDALPSERELMERLQVGRSSVREALRSLATLNVIEIRPGRGAFVREPGAADLLPNETLRVLLNRDTMIEIVEARTIIEGELAAMAAERATAADIRQIVEILDEADQCVEDVDRSLALNAQFHLAVAEAAHNGVLTNMLQSVRDYLSEKLQELSRDVERMKVSAADHRYILECIQSGNTRCAREAMHTHLSAVRRQVETTH